jgi:hypothetical protein
MRSLLIVHLQIIPGSSFLRCEPVEIAEVASKILATCTRWQLVLIGAVFPKEIEYLLRRGGWTMSENVNDLIERLHREAFEKGRREPTPPYEPPTVHYTELPEPQKDSPLFQEWNFYRREVGRLLAEGQEGRWLLIKGEDVLGIWDTREEAEAIALQKFLMQPCLIHQVRCREPIVRLSARLRR